MGQVQLKAFVSSGDRRQVSLRGYALGPKRDSDVTIADLSYGGCQIQSADAFKPGEKFELRVIKRGSMQVEVRWACDGRAGAQFIG